MSVRNIKINTVTKIDLWRERTALSLFVQLADLFLSFPPQNHFNRLQLFVQLPGTTPPSWLTSILSQNYKTHRVHGQMYVDIQMIHCAASTPKQGTFPGKSLLCSCSEMRYRGFIFFLFFLVFKGEKIKGDCSHLFKSIRNPHRATVETVLPGKLYLLSTNSIKWLT